VQREKIEQWAQLRSVEIAAWHTDLDQSGGKLKPPRASNLMLARVRTGQTGGLAVARLDRLSAALASPTR
jgi:DNA invertase Pin-like site-specific DNA recombinase